MNVTSSVSIEAVAKPKSGKGAARELRRNGFIPAVIYGVGADPVHLGIKEKDLARALRAGHFFTTTQELKLEGKAVKVLAREIQRHPVTETPIHIDFMNYNPKQMIHVDVMVHLVGEEECPGIKQGGVLQLIETNIEVICRADSIPSEIAVDISKLEIGDSVHLEDIKLPEGVKAATDRDLTIASIISTRTSTMAELDAQAEAEAAGAAAPSAEVPAINQKEGEGSAEEGKDAKEGKKDDK